MALPSTVTTNLYPDFKSAVIGPYPRVLQDKQDTSVGPQSLGDSSAFQALGQSFTPAVSGKLISVDISCAKNGSPTDNLQLDLYTHNSINDQPGTLLATAKPIPGGIVLASSSVGPYMRAVFPSPFDIVAGTTYWLRLSRSGAVNSGNYYRWFYSNANPYAGGKFKSFNGTGWGVVVSGVEDARFKANIPQPGRYVLAVDKTANKIRCYKTTDNETWTEQDSANAPAVSSTTSLKSFYSLLFDTQISVFIITSATRLDIFNYNVTTDTWGSSAFNATAAFNVSHVSGVAAMIGGFRSPDYPADGVPLSDYLFVNNGATETVMGNPRRRVKLSRRLISGGTWNTPYDVVGSSQTPDATLPGTAVDYDLRGAYVDDHGFLRVLWTQSDDTSIRQRGFNHNNLFGLPSVIGSPAAVTSNTAAYPMGQPVLFFKAPNWWVAFPYVDSGVLKVARARTDLVESASSWTLTTVTTATIEVTTSNPAVLVSDNENGSKLFALFVKSDGKLYITNDGGTDTWVEPQEFRPGTKTVAGLSVQALSDAIALVYQDNSPTPDVVKYDQSEVFF